MAKEAIAVFSSVRLLGYLLARRNRLFPFLRVDKVPLSLHLVLPPAPSLCSVAAAEERMKETSEPTGSPAPVIQHSSLAPSPSVGHNGLSSRAAAEAMAMSVLAGMGQQQRAEGGVSHIIMAAQSQSAAR